MTSETYDYVIQVIARDSQVAGEMVVALTGNAADLQSFTDECAVPMQRDGEPAWALEFIARKPAHDATQSFVDGGNPLGLPAEENAAKRATMDVRTSTRAIQGTLREWAAELGYTVREAGQ